MTTGVNLVRRRTMSGNVRALAARFDENYPETLKDLVLKMREERAEKRISISQILKHPFIKKSSEVLEQVKSLI